VTSCERIPGGCQPMFSPDDCDLAEAIVKAGMCAALPDTHWSHMYAWTNDVALFRRRPIGVRVCGADPRRGRTRASPRFSRQGAEARTLGEEKIKLDYKRIASSKA
jgi:hypothetical protein